MSREKRDVQRELRLERDRRRDVVRADAGRLERLVATGMPAADVAEHVAASMRAGHVDRGDVRTLAGTASVPVGRAIEGVVATPAVMRKESPSEESESASTEDLFARLGPGEPLSKAARAALEGRFAALGQEADFSRVRVHTSAEADELCRHYGAEAFTVGDHIAFRSGAFVPATRGGLELVAHELTHVLQQQRGVAPTSGVSQPGDLIEREADSVAAAVTRTEAAPVIAEPDTAEHTAPTTAVMTKKKPQAAAKPVENGDVVSGWVIYEDEARKGGSLAWRNNNPGNIRPGSFTASHGAFAGKKNHNFAIFPDRQTGYLAIKALLSENYASLTLTQTFQKYAPASDNNDPAAYAASVEKRTGIKASRKIEDLNDAELTKVADAIGVVEGWKAGTTVSRTDPKLPKNARKTAATE